MPSRFHFIVSLLTAILFIGCKQSSETQLPAASIESNTESRNLTEDFKSYWYAGKAEITSYKLSQERYGELRNGTAVNIFVTEDFLPEIQVKADRSTSENIPVLKLNQTKNYITGIYPYSVMTSVFSPTNRVDDAVKISHSMQEWCGHVYVQLNNKEDYNIRSHSYFEGEADQEFSLEKVWLENDIWTRIRINPEELPTGEFQMLPSFEFFRMSHLDIKPATADAILQQGDSISSYSVTYPELKRSLSIYFNSKPPYEIERWEQVHPNGLTSTAEKMKRIRSAYWGQNSKQFEYLRDTLQLNQ